MISTTKSRGGRPVSVYHPKAGGDPVIGLTRLGDGRWRVSGSERFTFTEPDESRAITRCLEYQAQRAGGSPIDMVEVASGVDIHDVGKHVTPPIKSRVTIRIPKDHTQGVTVERSFDTSIAWAWFAQQLIERPQYVAQRTGIEQLGYLPQLTKPKPSPKLIDVGDLYRNRTDVGEKESQKCGSTWKEFSRAVGVKTLREITPEAVAQWGVSVRRKGLAPKSIAHAFNRIKTVLNHYRSTGLSIDDVRHALDCCAVLKTPEATSLDPHPIARSTFAKLLEKAEGEGEAMLLVALNLCFYPIDLVRLKWFDLDMERGLYHAKRGKTKVARAGVLWKRTIDALAKIERVEDSDRVFHKGNGQMHTDTTVRKWFWALRVAAGIPKDVQFADIRDGSFTEAVAGEGVEFQHARVLAGHRSGIADAYVLRNPKMVAKACAAVELAYFG